MYGGYISIASEKKNEHEMYVDLLLVWSFVAAPSLIMAFIFRSTPTTVVVVVLFLLWLVIFRMYLTTLRDYKYAADLRDFGP